MPDLIGDFINRLLALDPGVSIHTADRLTYELRREWGGQRIYIARNPGGHQTELSLRLQAPEARTVSRWTRRRRG